MTYLRLADHFSAHCNYANGDVRQYVLPLEATINIIRADTDKMWENIGQDIKRTEWEGGSAAGMVWLVTDYYIFSVDPADWQLTSSGQKAKWNLFHGET